MQKSVFYAQERRAFWRFSIPALIVFTAFWMLPILITIPFSLIQWNGVGGISSAKFVGLKNYMQLFSDKAFWQCLEHNLWYMSVTVICIPSIAFFLALFIEKFVHRKAFFRTSLFIPIVLPMMLVTLMFKQIYNGDYGLLNGFLRLIGLESITTDWLGNKKTALTAVSFISVWKSTPFTMIILLAGLQSVSKDIEESALIDGCGFWKSIWYVTIPQLTPVLIVAIGLVIIDGFRVFDTIFLTTDGGPGIRTTEVIGTYIYKSGFMNTRIGFASALSFVNICIVMIISGVYLTISLKAE
jgi:ABC-type sugar transport system permease subunit